MASVTTTTGTADHVSMEFESHLKNVSEKATKSKERKLTDRQRRAKRSRQQDSARYSLSSSPPASVISAATTFAEVGLQIESGEVDLESLLALKEDDPRFNAQLALISKLREQLTDDDDCEEEEEGERHEHCAPATACSSSMCLVLASPWSTTSGQYLELEETPATNPFEVLPEEVLFVIFSFLHGQDISNAVEKVCKHWRTLAQDDQLWLSLLRRAYPEEAAEFKKTANRSWKWLYRSRKFIIESPEAIKGAVTGRYESAEYIYEGEWLDGKHHGWGKKIWKNLRYDTEEESDSATETEALKEEEGDSEQEGDANASGDPTNAEAQALDKQAPQPSHPQSAKAKKPKKKVVLSYYEGEWKEGKEHGRGMRLFEEDHYYFGEWKEGEREGTGYYHWPNKTFYEGEFKEGFRHGTGSYTWSEKARYVGGWQRGIEHGVGVRTWADGDRYEGDWVHGTRTGKGRYTWPNGSSYQGQWLQCAHEGHGVYRWPDGRMYKGEFSNNKKHGYGEYNWPDGAMFAGHWRAGVRHGEGSMKWSDGTKFVGVWSFDKRGDGKYYLANGDEVPFATGAAWTKKYDLYFSMPMDVWETMYLPEINKLIQEKKKKEHESRAQEQQMRMQQLRVSGSSIANTTSTSSTSGDEGDDVDNDNDNDDSDVDLSTSSSTAMAEEDESQSDGDRTD